MTVTKKRFIKDPEANLDYAFDWRPWLQAGETISSYTLVGSANITINQALSHETGGIVIAWINGGADEHEYEITCHIVTSQTRIDDRTMIIQVAQR